MKRLFFDKPLSFFIILVVICIASLYVTYVVSLKEYTKLEEIQNNKNIANFIYVLKIKYKDVIYTDDATLIDIKTICSNFFNSCNINSRKDGKNKSGILTHNYDSKIINKIPFYNNQNNFLFQVQTTSNKELTNEARNSILTFTLVLFIFLILTILIIRTLQKHLNKVNENLEEKVEKRTKQIQHTMKELEKVNLKLYDLAHTDYLTQIKNRRSFFMHADSVFDKLAKSGDVMSIIMIDIDNFKSFNDTYGHEVGDKILKIFASCIREVLLKDQIFGRLGGEEFAIALPYTNIDDAFKIAETIRKKVERIVINIPSSKLFITASFGVSDSTNTKSVDEIIKNADNLLYEAKNSGKNRVRSRQS